MGYQVKYKVWVEADGASFLGSGRIKLLKAVDELGSLNKAAKLLNISYKKAWDLIKSVNDAGQESMTTTTIGGSAGGGMRLTPYAKKMITQFENLHNHTSDFIKHQRIES
ncbi:MAG: molybdate transport system regulatory protein [Marivirga sp.]|jgi:molybdate transport system regulatory protein